jgi:hypothetical protein
MKPRTDKILRSSQSIGLKAAQTLYYAVGEYADTIGYPLTHLVTIDFARTTVLPTDLPAYLSHLFALLRKRLTRPARVIGSKVPATWSWILENSRNGRAIHPLDANTHNLHVHIAIHLPPSRVVEVQDYLSGRLSLVARTSRDRHALQVKSISAPLGLRRYFLKGTTPRWASRFGILKPRSQGLVPGNRSGTSRNLGPAARRASDRERGIRRRRPTMSERLKTP